MSRYCTNSLLPLCKAPQVLESFEQVFINAAASGVVEKSLPARADSWKELRERLSALDCLI